MAKISLEEKLEMQKWKGIQEHQAHVIALETQFKEEIRILNEKRDAEVFAEQARAHETGSQSHAQQRQLTKLRESGKSEAKRFQNIIAEKDTLLMAAEEQIREVIACQEQLRADLELSKHALEKERQAVREAVRPQWSEMALKVGTSIKEM